MLIHKVTTLRLRYLQVCGEIETERDAHWLPHKQCSHWSRLWDLSAKRGVGEKHIRNQCTRHHLIDSEADAPPRLKWQNYQCFLENGWLSIPRQGSKRQVQSVGHHTLINKAIDLKLHCWLRQRKRRRLLQISIWYIQNDGQCLVSIHTEVLH